MVKLINVLTCFGKKSVLRNVLMMNTVIQWDLGSALILFRHQI